jgi:hypothetical protein
VRVLAHAFAFRVGVDALASGVKSLATDGKPFRLTFPETARNRGRALLARSESAAYALDQGTMDPLRTIPRLLWRCAA